MLLQIFAAWPEPSWPAWITAFAIGSRNGFARSNCSSVPPTIRASVPAAAAAIPPETGASTKVEALGVHRLSDFARAGDVDRRAVDQESAGLRIRCNVVLEHRSDVLGGGEHGDDDIGVLHCFGGRSGGRAAAVDSFFDSFRDQVERADLMARLGEVRRHSAAHMAQADECDAAPCSSVPSNCPAASRRRRPCLPSGPRFRTGRGTGGARSGCPGRAGFRTRH